MPAPDPAVPSMRRVPKLTALLALLLLAGNVLALDPDKSFHHYVRNNWSIEEGLPQISALAITQDRTGYLWVGTQAGLARFDGIRFQAFNPETTPGLRGIWIHDLHVDPANRIWIATYRGLSVYEDGQFRAVPVAGDEPGRALDTTDIEAMPSGDLMVAAPDGVYRATGKELALLHPLPRPATALLARGADLWVGSRGRVYRISEGDTQLLPMPDGDDDTVVTQLLDAHGRLWAATSNGLFFREGDQWLRYEGDPRLANTPIESMYEDRDGNLWIGMVDDLARLRAGRVTEVVRNDPMGSAVRAMFEDREGNLWLGSQWEGITRVWNGWTRRYSSFEGLQDQIVWSVARGQEGELWVGTNSGLSVMQDGDFREVIAGADLPHPNAYTLLPERDAIWIGTRRGVAVLRNGADLELPAVLAPMRSAQVNGILRDQRGALWFASTAGLFRLTRDGLTGFGAAQGLRDPRTRVLHETRDGRLLVGTQSGLYELQGNKLEPLGLEAGLRSDLDVTAIHELPDGRLVIGALSEEIFLEQDGRWHAFDAGLGMPVNSPFFITHGQDGYLWVAGIRGVHRVLLQDMTDVAAGNREDVRGEMLLNERGDRRGGQKGFCCNGAGNAKGFIERGELWLPTRDGVVAMATRGIVKNATAPRTVIERIQVGGEWRPADASADWQLAPNQRDLAFEFTVLSLQDPKSVELRYRLVGYDADWRTLDDPTRRNVNYTNLPPGAYVFEAEGSNNADTWSPAPAQVGFRIQPKFHETPLFYWLLAGLGASIVYAGYRRQLGKHRRQREALELLVSQRTEALEVANHRLEEASQTDPLTGLRNRRYLANQIPADIAYYDRETVRRGSADEVMVFALIDIDHFKDVNDTHGHQAGDRVLQQVAQVLGQMVRTGDYIARWGGEEFLIVFRPMPNRHLPMLGDRICACVSEHRFDIGGTEPLRITCSVGFIECPLFRDARGGLGWEQMIEMADRALYYVKAHGRNGWAAYRAREDTDLAHLQEALRGDPDVLLEAGRLALLTSDKLTPPPGGPGH
ncbi:GGDEF domain-containing protein [Arenimonas soli]|uniref:diguanylate cyclase n=1 Tax=Arenimonas soli TaxID=2269504 RepID=A0ABQ1HS93_9GAMM|nr:ligand-binding sensor domain-containing diguanylate cyclase [Arenimonas soli]GGA85882.1 GGDEF domain-containing protein [Arenimonas soli]